MRFIDLNLLLCLSRKGGTISQCLKIKFLSISLEIQRQPFGTLTKFHLDRLELNSSPIKWE